MHIVIIGGSLRTASCTRALYNTVAEQLTSKGVQVTCWDLLQRQLPAADPDFHSEPLSNPDEDAQHFIRLCTSADGYVWGTPIYHNSFSGILKNAIDLLNIEICGHKTVGLISHGGARSPQGVDQLRIVARGLNCIAIPAQVCTAREDFEFTDEGISLSSVNIKNRINRFCDELIFITGRTK